jgi:hypothetical protein
LAVGLKEKHSVPIAHLKNAFNDQPFLKKWADRWSDALDILGEDTH